MVAGYRSAGSVARGQLISADALTSALSASMPIRMKAIDLKID